LKNLTIEEFLDKNICPICGFKFTNEYYYASLCKNRDFANTDESFEFSFQMSKRISTNIEGFSILKIEKKIIYRKNWLIEAVLYMKSENIILSLDFSDQEHSLNDLFLICKKLAILE